MVAEEAFDVICKVRFSRVSRAILMLLELKGAIRVGRIKLARRRAAMQGPSPTAGQACCLEDMQLGGTGLSDR